MLEIRLSKFLNSTIKLKFVLQLIQVIKKEGRYNGIRRNGGGGWLRFVYNSANGY